MLRWRLTVSAILIPALIALCALDARSGPPAILLLILVVILAARSSWEFCQLTSVREFRPSTLHVGIGSVFIAAAAWFPQLVPTAEISTAARLTSILVTFVLTFLAFFVLAAKKYREASKHLETLSVEVLGTAYCGLLLAMTTLLRWQPEGFASASDGYLAVGSLLVAAKCGDVGAYTLGRLFGKRKMVPHLSPGKTWMGAYGALLGATLGTMVWIHIACRWLGVVEQIASFMTLICFGILVGVVGLIGDLCESLIKRDVGKKDSATLMPGFGGLLDLLDSVIFAGPVALLFWWFWPLVVASPGVAG